ncbi:hypothetical protein HMPREF7215_1872 [Pyramidobacter piscolens W5455]|uniref:Uncharacterized protein n=1 Tax=Pyramidobacter piscolens W5455 TaxID=352165 RepID=A0ABM9ZUD1_9BACT|nr:hypothetical protein HMPREF7215_1872 [Pyramidobacter piscolens W5455]
MTFCTGRWPRRKRQNRAPKFRFSGRGFFCVAERASAAGEDLGVVMAFSIAELGGSV